MDGASKFVTGDAIAGVVITVVNIIGGLALGIFQRGMPATEALQTYTILTIGDGLVSQIPALLISLSAGMLVAKTDTDAGGTGAHLVKQIFNRHQPLFLCSFMLFVLAVLPGFPFFPFATLASGSFVVGMVLYRRNQLTESTLKLSGAGGVAGALPGASGNALPGSSGDLAAPGVDTALPKINPMTLELGFSLVPLVDPNHEGDLVSRISMIRKQIKDEMGFLIPPISIQDNIELGNNEYRIMVRGLERARGSVYPSSHMAINPGDAHGDIDGVKTNDPAFGFDAVWIPPAKIDAAESMGYTVVDAASVITTHVTKIVKDYAAELISRQDVSNMIEQVKERNETVVSELIPNLLSIGVVHRVLQHLLDEKVPIHDLSRILEVLSDYATQTKDPVILCEFARQALKGHIVARHVGEDRSMYAITLDPAVEEEIQTSISHGSGGGIMSLSPERASEITDAIKNAFARVGRETDHEVILLVSPLIRLHMFRLLDRKMEHISVLSYSEVSDDVPLRVLSTVKLSGKGSIAA
ncbi:MAG: hypothetical protein A2X49_07225 [Lentisphaerae bacterium GWF2_52_8]|nr:MAG: hypothetical protein A2X49_07225 [Lentisphaerae bacterium GWF2_52_8]